MVIEPQGQMKEENDNEYDNNLQLQQWGLSISILQMLSPLAKGRPSSQRLLEQVSSNEHAITGQSKTTENKDVNDLLITRVQNQSQLTPVQLEMTLHIRISHLV